MNSESISPKQVELHDLRALLRQRFPEAQRRVEKAMVPLAEEVRLPEADGGEAPHQPQTETGGLGFRTGIRSLDAEGVPGKGLMEVVGGASSGLDLVVWSVIYHGLRAEQAMALVDGGDGCDVARAWPEDLMKRLLWVRCQGVEEAVRATDLLVRDGNIRYLLVHLPAFWPTQEKQERGKRAWTRVPLPVWYRLRNVAEENGLWVMVASQERTVPCAMMRCQLRGRFGLDDLSVPRAHLLRQLAVQVEHRQGGLRREVRAKDEIRQAG